MSIKVGYPNYFSATRYSGLSASSADSEFPVTNLDGVNRRTKVWQSAGYFLVTSANKVIRFRDASGGADKDATIAEGAYTTVTAFLTAVDTAMEAAGAANYTVTQNSTSKKFIFTSDVSGGATHFELRCADAAFTAADLLGFAAVNRTGATTYTADAARIHSEEFILLDLGSSFNPKAFALFGPRNEPLRISQTAVVKLQGNATDSWSSPAFNETLEWNEFSIASFNASGLHTTALRYWRISIVDRDNTRGYLEISSLFLGDLLDITRGCPQFPLDIEEVDLSVNAQTMSASRFTTTLGKTSQIFLDWDFLTPAENEAIMDLFADVGVGYPFHIFIDPNEVFSTAFQRWVMQVTFDTPIKPKLDGPGRWSSPWQLIEDV